MSFKYFIATLFFLNVVATIAEAQQQIIPTPVTINAGKEYFSITPTTYILANDFSAFMDASAFREILYAHFNIPIKTAIKPLPSLSTIEVSYDSTLTIPESGYILDIAKDKITITGKNNGGVFYGLMSLLQLIPIQDKYPYNIPSQHIEDYPAFQWRGMHLDVVRHFFSVDEIKTYLDILAIYKINVFHWHLTDDQGWRIEIKQYPKLTEIGAWRNGTMTGHYSEQTYDSISYGGFYTQVEIKEIIKYAAQRNITIVPEIEMPGHVLALLASYPELSCTGNKFEVAKGWGVFDDILCPYDTTFTFLENVLDEVMALFPSEYIHIGGDEAPKMRWKESAFCQQLIQEKNLGDEAGLQSYFIQRIEEYVNSKGRKIIGWDEILEGGLAPNAAVMSWRGEEGGIDAAKQNHEVVMCPVGYCYFDYYQSDIANEPLAIGGYLPIEKVYAFNPIPTALHTDERKFILGGQANIWTEYIPDFKQVEYMLLPRLCALSEIVWSNPQQKDFDVFGKKVMTHFAMYDKAKINYSKAMLDVRADIFPDYSNHGVNVILRSMDSTAKVLYTIDNSDPAKTTNTYKQVISVDSNTTLRAISFSNNIYGPTLFKEFIFSKITASKITLTTPANDKYNVHGEFTLCDGLRGKHPWRGSEWLGFWGDDLEAVIDPGRNITISKVSAGVLQDEGSWIYYPSAMEVYISSDGINYEFKGFISADKIKQSNGNISVEFNTITTRYLKIILKNAGTIPEGLPGAGFKAWLFVDELLAY